MAALVNHILSTSFAYSKVEAVSTFNVAALERDHSAAAPSLASSHASTNGRQTRRMIDRDEPCFITKRPSYTLERAHWVNAVKKNRVLKEEIEAFLVDLGIVHDKFNLNGASNLANLDRMLHVSLDKYGFFAVTASLPTLRAIIPLVEEQNRIWQERFDIGGKYIRFFQLPYSPFSDAEYDLVVLHPEHFLPNGSTLTLYTRVNNQLHGKNYVVGHDRTLRESPGTPSSPRCPAFKFDARPTFLPLNVFLVVLNAEIKFRRYRRMRNMPRLPDEVEMLMDETIRLLMDVDVDIENTSGSDLEMGTKPADEEDNQDTIGKSGRRTVVRRRGDNMTLEQRKEHMQYLLSARDFELDSDDEELLEELGYGPDISRVARPAVPGSDTNTLDPIHVAQKVGQWQQTLEVK